MPLKWTRSSSNAALVLPDAADEIGCGAEAAGRAPPGERRTVRMVLSQIDRVD